MRRSYRRDFWAQQPDRVEVWSEKGTVRGVLAPILDEYGVGFRVMHGFSSATSIYDVAQGDDGRTLHVLYVGDFDPSGMWMSMHDLPERLERYGGDHVELLRVALGSSHVGTLSSFPASDKTKDPRYKWFVSKFGNRCCEFGVDCRYFNGHCRHAGIPLCLGSLAGEPVKAWIAPTRRYAASANRIWQAADGDAREKCRAKSFCNDCNDWFR